MEVTRSANRGIKILQLTGRFDAHEVEPVNAWFQEQLTLGNTNLVINLEEVNFVDSTALATMVRGLKHCRERNGDLHLCSLQQPVRVIFELTRLDKAFDIYPSEMDASGAFQ
jgi:anti-sigma B factor antagonist